MTRTTTPLHEPRVAGIAAPHWAETIATAQREAAAAEAQRQAAELETAAAVRRVFERDRVIFQNLLAEEIQRAATAFQRGGGPMLRVVVTADRVSIGSTLPGGPAFVIFTLVENPAPALAVATGVPGGRQSWPLSEFVLTPDGTLAVVSTDGLHGPEDLVRTALKPWLQQLTLANEETNR
ncbi:MAG: hypothetical protein Q7W02_02455 [Candidatus Rokubacteria bacterium]|nr:hypothetical protein [Candidatus Rokubacteria bacterium]